MEMFNKGNYASALAQNSVANAISKILYPNDNHLEGKSLRLRQQYFLCAAAVGDIVNNHMNVYGTLDNLADRSLSISTILTPPLQSLSLCVFFSTTAAILGKNHGTSL